jgi:hypothetical protein
MHSVRRECGVSAAVVCCANSIMGCRTGQLTCLDGYHDAGQNGDSNQHHEWAEVKAAHLW